MLSEKFFLWNAIPNLIVILLLLYYLSIRKGVGAVIAALFVYLSLHGGYAIFAAATGDGINTLNALHYESSDLGAKLVGLFFITSSLVLLFNRLNFNLQTIRENSKLALKICCLLISFLLVMVFGSINLVNINSSSLLNIFKEIFYAVSMWIYAFLFALVLKQGGKYLIAFRTEWIIVLAVLSIIMVISGSYELITETVWAGTPNAAGFSYRASGTLFNPNVLGFWSALMVLLTSFMFHIRWISRFASLGFMLLSVACLILSSSRSGFMLSIINVVAISLFMLGDKKAIRNSPIDKCWPAISFVIAFFFCVALIEYVNPVQSLFTKSLLANLYRLTQLPVDIFSIFLVKIYFPLTDVFPFLPKFRDLLLILNANLSDRISESIEGRTAFLYTSDNSFISIYVIGTIVALALWLSLWALLLWYGLARNYKFQGIYSSYALVGWIFCFASGLFLRSPQLFPIWIFMSMVLGACICWWFLVDNSNNLR